MTVSTLLPSLEHQKTLDDLEKLFQHLEIFKQKIESEKVFTAQDLQSLKQILDEFKKLEAEVTNLVRISKSESENELFILYNDALEKITSAQIFLDDIYQRHYAKFGDYYTFENTDNSPKPLLHSQKSPAQKLMHLMAHLLR